MNINNNLKIKNNNNNQKQIKGNNLDNINWIILIKVILSTGKMTTKGTIKKIKKLQLEQECDKNKNIKTIHNKNVLRTYILLKVKKVIATATKTTITATTVFTTPKTRNKITTTTTTTTTTTSTQKRKEKRKKKHQHELYLYLQPK